MSTASVLRPQPAHQSTPHSQQFNRQASPSQKNMSITQTYYLAHTARGKLSRQAARPDHNLRLLVGHANLLDSLMLELADAEREQERWFNQSVRGASNTTQKTSERRIQWADQVVEEVEEEYEFDDSSDSDSDYDEEDDIDMIAPAPKATIQYAEVAEDDDEDYAQLSLVRTSSHSSPPPELHHGDEDSSDDESMPPSPPQPSLSTFSTTASEKEVEDEDDDEESTEQRRVDDFYEERFYVPSTRSQARLISAVSVY